MVTQRETFFDLYFVGFLSLWFWLSIDLGISYGLGVVLEQFHLRYDIENTSVSLLCNTRMGFENLDEISMWMEEIPFFFKAGDSNSIVGIVTSNQSFSLTKYHFALHFLLKF